MADPSRLLADYQVRETRPSLGAAAVVIAVGDPLRIALLLKVGTTAMAGSIWVGTQAALAANQGVALDVAGGGLELLALETGPLCQLTWYGVSAPASNGLTVLEILAVPSSLLIHGG